LSLNFGGSRIALVAAGLVVSGVLFIACGGDGGSDSPSKDDFIAQADQICAEFNNDSDARVAEVESLINNGDFDGAADLFLENADLISGALDEIEALGVPEGDEQTVEDWIALGREQAATAEEVAEAIRVEDGAAITAGIEKGDANLAEADAIADEYGMIDCGSAGNDS
jgi:hypothetical protein